MKKKILSNMQKGFRPKQGKSLKNYAIFRFSCKPKGGLFRLPENCNLNSFVWVFLLILSGVFRLSVKYGLPRFLLSTTITIITKNYLFSIV